ncbi:MAG TPA: transglycosylase SLT domain-containing protein [Methylomirabilota bacterium]
MALATALAGVCPPVALAQSQSYPGTPAGDSTGYRLAAVPEPPTPPRPPTLAPPADSVAALDEAVDEPEPDGGLAVEIRPAFPTEAAADEVDERRSDPIVRVPPGLPVPSYPVVVNAPVEALIDYFVAKDRERFGMWISRSGRYLPMIQRILRERGLPEELAYTAMIESGFSPRAVSRVGARGMWQFMEATGRRYGLVINRWLDERLDPVKSTMAAAEYLGDLYGIFGHWFLAQAGYNAGEARVGRAIQRARTSDFWALTQTRHLPDETKLFVPQILAAAVITRAPARYGFDVTLDSPLAYDEVTIRRALDLDTIARLAGVSAEEIRELNPALLARITPPFGSYTLRLPPGAGPRFGAALEAAPPSSLPTWIVHRIGRNQSLAEIARRYRVTTQRLSELNHLPGGRLRGIRELVVPAVAQAAPAPAGPREVVVRKGDTLSAIASRHRVTPQALARLNGMDLDDPLTVGARLRLSTP